MAKNFERKLDRICFLVDLLRKHEFLTIEEINSYWLYDLNTDGIAFDRWSLKTELDFIRVHFGIDVVHQKRDSHAVEYYIDNPNEISNHFKLMSWSMKAFKVGDVLMRNKKLFRRVLLEDFPCGLQWLDKVLRAMAGRHKIRIHYRKYKHKKGKDHLLVPLFLKEYHLRLYLIAKTHFGNTCPFALDRIRSFEETDETAAEPNVQDAEEYFENAYGVVADEKRWPAQMVRIRAFNDEPDYMIDQPLHNSQRIIRQEDEFTDFDSFIGLTNDFIGYLMGRGDRIKVLSPSSLAEELRNRHLAAAELYSDLTTDK